MGVKIGRIHSHPRGVTSGRCGFLPNYIRHLFIVSAIDDVNGRVSVSAYCYRRSSVVCLCVCLLVTFVSPAKTDEGIEMPFGG